MNFIKSLLMLLCLLELYSEVAGIFCYRNITVIEKPKGIRKVFQKPKITWRLEEECCMGYTRVSEKQCDPICENGCPSDSKCVAPNQCSCQQGHKMSMASNSFQQECVPECSPECKDTEVCVQVNVCACKPDLVREPKTQNCVSPLTIGVSPSTVIDEEQENESTSATAPEAKYVTNEQDEVDDSDYIEILVPIQTNDTYNCTHNLTCFENAFCTEIGACECMPGFSLFINNLTTSDDQEYGINQTCVNDEELQELLKLETITPQITNYLPYVLASLIGTVVLVVIVIGGFAFRKRNRGKIDVQAKNDLCCEYNNKSFTQTQMVY